MTAKEIKELIDLMRGTAVTELELEREGVRIRIKMGQPAMSFPLSEESGSHVPRAEQGETGKVAPPSGKAGRVVVTSPFVGVFYRAPSLDADPYVEVGDPVHKGQVLCVIEAMKLMNEIHSDVDGKVAEILVENAHPVEYGTPLFSIEPLSLS